MPLLVWKMRAPVDTGVSMEWCDVVKLPEKDINQVPLVTRNSFSAKADAAQEAGVGKKVVQNMNRAGYDVVCPLPLTIASKGRRTLCTTGTLVQVVLPLYRSECPEKWLPVNPSRNSMRARIKPS
jgi:hypothetical protein